MTEALAYITIPVTKDTALRLTLAEYRRALKRQKAYQRALDRARRIDQAAGQREAALLAWLDVDREGV